MKPSKMTSHSHKRFITMALTKAGQLFYTANNGLA